MGIVATIVSIGQVAKLGLDLYSKVKKSGVYNRNEAFQREVKSLRRQVIESFERGSDEDFNRKFNNFISGSRVQDTRQDSNGSRGLQSQDSKRHTKTSIDSS